MLKERHASLGHFHFYFFFFFRNFISVDENNSYPLYIRIKVHIFSMKIELNEDTAVVSSVCKYNEE